MSLLLLAYPRLEQADRARIQAIRAQHNPEHFKLIEPHFTLVFPVESLSVSRFTAHAARCLADARQVQFVLRRARVVSDPPHRESHVFLVPGRGRKALTMLHDRLYTGPLAPALRRDIRFIPHITVGNSVDRGAASALASELNAAGIKIPGIVDTVDAVHLQERRVETLRRFPLRP